MTKAAVTEGRDRADSLDPRLLDLLSIFLRDFKEEMKFIHPRHLICYSHSFPPSNNLGQ